jgi:hypothetical protein
MEGFSRPGSLGGEITDDDIVEGHMMDDRDQTQDTEGHGISPKDFSPKDAYPKDAWPKADGDDTEGHGISPKDAWPKADPDDDTEGHAGWLKATDDDDDTEGHANLK